MASLMMVLPADLVKHIKLNQTRLKTWELLKQEVVAFAEAHADKPPEQREVNPFLKGPQKGPQGGKGGVIQNG